MVLQYKLNKQIDLRRTYTAEEFENLPDDGNRYELIEGRLIKMPPAGDAHGSIGMRIVTALILFDPESKLGKLWFTTGFKLDNKNTPEPDLMYIVASRRPTEDKMAVQIIPDLVMEIGSPSQITKTGLDTDSMDKIRKYQKAGVKIIWSINPSTQTVEVYHPTKPTRRKN
jgi:Uma2 family endonuclease